MDPNFILLEPMRKFDSTPSLPRFILQSQSKFIVILLIRYWLAQESLTSDIQKAVNEAAAAGYTFIRTWGFNDVTTTSGVGTYYQLWANGVGTINTGADGLAKFDTVVAAAKA